MNKKILTVSILATALVILFPISSVVGFNTAQTQRTTISSPLFENRINHFLQKEKQQIPAQYLGKGAIINLFLTRQSTLQRMINKAIQVIQSQPEILTLIIQRIESNPKIINLIATYGTTIEEIKQYTTMIKNDPSLIQQVLDQVENPNGDDPQQLGLSTSNPLGCFIVAIALVPVVLILSIMIATLTIITCLNIGGCLETIFNNIAAGIIEGLTPP